MDYRTDTRDAYRSDSRARAYEEQYTRGTKWARFTMWRQRALIKGLLDRCGLDETSNIIDLPCGTGFIGKELCETRASVVASDISPAMMARARSQYSGPNFHGFVQCDITGPPFKEGSFDCVILLALMHRLPRELRHKALRNIAWISKRFIIVSYSLDSGPQRLKQWVTRIVYPGYTPAPSPLPLQDIIAEIESFALVVRRRSYVARFFSGKLLLLVERNGITVADRHRQ